MKITVKSKHKVDYCQLCQCTMIRCGTCNNNCCNAGYGEVDEKVCPDCPSAYEEQNIMWRAKKSSTN